MVPSVFHDGVPDRAFDPRCSCAIPGKFVPTGNLNAPRISHTATLLNDGRVLITGGYRGYSRPGGTIDGQLNSAELYDPVSGTFSPTGSMTTSRSGHTAALLLDGRVLVTGGFADDDFSVTATAELYDPRLVCFSATGNMHTTRVFHAATLLSTGKVLISGTEGSESRALRSRDRHFRADGICEWQRLRGPATRLLNGDVLLGGYFYGPDAAVYNTMTGNVEALTFPDLVHVAAIPRPCLPTARFYWPVVLQMILFSGTHLFDLKIKRSRLVARCWTLGFPYGYVAFQRIGLDRWWLFKKSC